MHYYGTRLSENISLRQPEGYLLCLNVPVARSGTQEYLPSELNLPPGREMIPVYRPEEEVFSPETVASFEGMPVTNDHPPDGVDAGNIGALQKGHAHNVRRGSGKDRDLLLADLIITDPELIDAVLKEGKREISCGYTYELCEEKGRYVQRRIRGNHVAVVDAGRAGKRVSIRDHQTRQTERRPDAMKKTLTKVLARMARDGEAEAVAEILEEILTPAPEEAGIPEEEAAQAAEEAEGTNIIIDEEGLAGICERLDRIIALLEPAARDEEPGTAAEALTEAVSEAVGAALENADPAAGEISAVMEEILEPAFSTLMETEGETDGEENSLPEQLCAGDALRAALRAVKPALARMPREQRRRVAGDIAARLRRPAVRGASDAGIYAAMASARRRNAPASADLGRRIMEKRNPHYRN